MNSTPIVNLDKLFVTQPLVVLSLNYHLLLIIEELFTYALGTVRFLLGKFVLAYLQDQLIHNATILADILPNTLEESQVVSTHMQAICGHNFLFVFDEWDKFPSHLLNNLLVSTIIQQPHKPSLHQSTILITMYLC